MRLAVVGIDHDVDPAAVVATNQSQMVLLDLLADGLTAIDPSDNQATASIASKWSLDSAGTTWTFDLKSNATFSDGTSITASRVIDALEHVASKPDSLQGSRLSIISGQPEFVSGAATHISGFVATDEYKLSVTTLVPDEDLPTLLASPLYGVTKQAEVASAPSTSAPAGPNSALWTVGSGPFRVDDPSGSLTSANRLARVKQDKARIATIELVRVADKPAALQAVQDGRADWAPAPAGTPEGAIGSPSTTAASSQGTVVSAPMGAEVFFGMNMANPTFASQQFRQAIVQAVDASKVASAGYAGVVANSAIVPPGVPGAVVDPCGASCRYNPEDSKFLLTQVFPDGKVPTIEIDTSDGAGEIAAANSVADQLIAVGIPAVVLAKPFNEYLSFVTSGNAQLFRFGWVGMSPTGGAYLAPLFRSKSLDNLTSFSSLDVDASLVAAAAVHGASKRAESYAAIEKAILAESPVMPIGAYRLSVGLGSSVHDYVAQLDGTFVVDKVWVDPGSNSSGN